MNSNKKQFIAPIGIPGTSDIVLGGMGSGKSSFLGYYIQVLNFLESNPHFPDFEFKNETIVKLDEILNSSRIYIFSDTDPFINFEKILYCNETYRHVSLEKLKHYIIWETNFSLLRLQELKINQNCLILIENSNSVDSKKELLEIVKYLQSLSVSSLWKMQPKRD